MSTKKIVFLILGIVAVLGLIVVLFVGAIVGFVFYTIGNSDAAEAARVYLRTNDKLKADIGEVKEFGWFVTGQVNYQNAEGEATLHLKVIGEKGVRITPDVLASGSGGGDGGGIGTLLLLNLFREQMKLPSSSGNGEK